MAGSEELVEFETDVLAEVMLACAAPGLSDATISSEAVHIEQVLGLARPTRCGR
ncbi:hypothetical protein [Nonomuraea zeae]|uniref:hypothetical protein n=1 Tax=Nonomuraea zeae TaxID=1642303 RepID=UPI0014780AD1|nr:hypothetical protein [Nonomuraea zeae]